MLLKRVNADNLLLAVVFKYYVADPTATTTAIAAAAVVNHASVSSPMRRVGLELSLATPITGSARAIAMAENTRK